MVEAKKSSILGLYAFPELDFPAWQQHLISAWLTDIVDQDAMERKDSWFLGEAVFYMVLEKPYYEGLHDLTNLRDFCHKAHLLSLKMCPESPFALETYEWLFDCYDRAVRAIAAEKLPAMNVFGKYWIEPGVFKQWWSEQEKKKLEQKQITPAKSKAMRNAAVKRIVEFWNLKWNEIPNVARLLERPEIVEWAAIFARLSPESNHDGALKYLEQCIREHPDAPKSKRGRPKNSDRK